jgi:hypothetical protein
MPRGYPDTITCSNCKEGLPGDMGFSFCPYCGQTIGKKAKKITYDLSNYTYPEREGIRKFLKDIKEEK